MKLGWLAALALALPCTPLLAGSVSFTSPRAGEVLSAGSTVTVRWDGIPRKAEELELLLSLDGGHSRVRIGAELDGATREISWQVPNLPARDAVFFVRFGCEGEEEVGGESAPFLIAAAPELPLPTISRREGEIWLGCGGSSAPPTPVDCDAPQESLSRLPATLEISNDRDDAIRAIRPASGAAAPRPEAGRPRDALESFSSRSHAPAVVPLRN